MPNLPNKSLVNKRHIEDYIDLLIESFKKNKNLPYKIKTGSSCPDKKKNCRKKHGEIIVKSYDRNQKKFHVFHYSIHNPKPVFDWWQDESKITEMVVKQNKKFGIGKKPLLRLLDIKKILDKSENRYRSEKIDVRVTPEEKDQLKKSAKKKDMRIADFIREKLFS